MLVHHQRLTLCLLCCITSTGLIGKKKEPAPKPQYPLITIESFQQAKKEFDHANPSTLFVFDIDETLIETADLSQQYHYKKDTLPSDFIPATEEAQQDFLQNLSLFQTYLNRNPALLNAIAIEQPYTLIDPLVVTFIKNLIKKGVPVIALSSFSPGSFGPIEKMEEYRAQTLRNLGIHFALPMDLLTKKNLSIFNYDNFSNNALYYEGIIACGFCDRQGHENITKGTVLKDFIKKLNPRPEKVVFFDNLFHNLDVVAISMKELAIPTTCYFMQGAYTRPSKPLDVAVAKKQFTYIMEHNRYISYEEAKKLLRDEKKLAAVPLHPSLVPLQSTSVISLPGSVEPDAVETE